MLRVTRLCPLILGLLATAAQAAPAGPGRIAVAGAYPNGYVGVLARYGLPRDLLSDDRFADSAVLRQYDLVIVGGLEDRTQPYDSVREYVAGGGRLLLDYSQPPRAMLPYLLNLGPVEGGPFRALRDGSLRGLLGVEGASRSPLKLSDEGRRSLPELLEWQPDQAPRLAFVPALPKEAQLTVLAEYSRTTSFSLDRVRGGDLRELFRGREPDSGPPAPALVLERRGAGQILYCGPGVGISTALMGANFDPLILALVRLLTDGRATPQLIPEGNHLGRLQNARTQNQRDAAPAAETESESETPPATREPLWPAGPGARTGLPAGYTELETEAEEIYNVSGELGDQSAEVLLNWWNAANLLKVTVTPAKLTVTRVSGGKARTLGGLDVALGRGGRFTLKLRQKVLTVVAGGQSTNLDVSGLQRGAVGVKGVADPWYQPVEPPFFTDDFMRTNEQDGGWTTSGGEWVTAPVENPDMGANPFSYKVATNGVATARQGFDFWDDYKFRCAIRPTAVGGRVGLGWYVQADDTMILFRGRVRPDGQSPTDGWQLVKLERGRETVLATAAGGFSAGQWYDVLVKAEGPWLGVFVDGVKLLVAQDRSFPGGGIALRVEQSSARFDDVRVESVDVTAERGARLVGRVPDYAGLMDVDSWAGPATPWVPQPDVDGLFWRVSSFFGPVGLRYDIPELPDGGGALLLCDGDGRSLERGSAVELRRRGRQLELKLRRDGQIVSEGTADLPAGPISLALRKSTDRIQGLLGERTIVSGSPPRRGEGRLAFQTFGFKPRISDLAVWSLNLLDYTFDTAPCDWWVGSGIWDLTNRWSCTPDWSWFGGYSQEVAAIWHKRPFGGDQVVDFYAGPKMLDAKNFGTRQERVGDFNATLCGDGRSVFSGYSFIVGDNGSQGAKILRQGQVVAAKADFQLFRRGHNRWANLRAEKHGAEVRLVFDGQTILSWVDPQPLSGGYVALWTQKNGVMLPRITLAFETAGEDLLSLR